MGEIRLDEEQLRTGTQSMKDCGEALASVECESINMTGNSEVLSNYIECFEKLRTVMNAYADLLQNDSGKILSAGEALNREDRNVLSGNQ